MEAAAFGQFIHEQGDVAVSRWLLDRYQSLDISPEELGYLLLALHHQQKSAPLATGASAMPEDAYQQKRSQGDDPWIGKALDKGWAKWKDDGTVRQAVFDPLWERMYRLWESEREAAEREANPPAAANGAFDYSKIVKELDRMRGSLSVTIREQQLIQEFNIKYGWSTDFILSFFRLCNGRNLMQIKSYKPLAAQIYRAGIFTLEGLEAFMSEVDWIGKQATEIKKDYLGLYGMVTVMERDYYVKWHITWKFSHVIILRAAQESVGAQHATFKYIDTIMERWHEKGVDTLEACEAAIKEWQEEWQNQAKARSGARQKGRTGSAKPEKERAASPWSGFAAESSEKEE